LIGNHQVFAGNFELEPFPVVIDQFAVVKILLTDLSVEFVAETLQQVRFGIVNFVEFLTGIPDLNKKVVNTIFYQIGIRHQVKSIIEQKANVVVIHRRKPGPFFHYEIFYIIYLFIARMFSSGKT
jgi:hypothetical protein